MINERPEQYGMRISGAAIASRPVRDVSGLVLDCGIPSRTLPAGYAIAKRFLDIALGLFALLVSLPILVMAGILIRLTSRGPIVFRQTRVGQGGKLFTCYKLRSMVADAEQRKRQLSKMNEATGPVFKMKNDPRITPIGRILRKSSIDELPQLWNVVRGDMSLVGPRPPVPSEVVAYSERDRGRLSVRPGLTCLWQVSGRSDVSFDRWVELDLMYIDTMSLWQDLRILARTVPAVVLARGAH